MKHEKLALLGIAVVCVALFFGFSKMVVALHDYARPKTIAVMAPPQIEADSVMSHSVAVERDDDYAEFTFRFSISAKDEDVFFYPTAAKYVVINDNGVTATRVKRKARLHVSGAELEGSSYRVQRGTTAECLLSVHVSDITTDEPIKAVLKSFSYRTAATALPTMFVFKDPFESTALSLASMTTSGPN